MKKIIALFATLALTAGAFAANLGLIGGLSFDSMTSVYSSGSSNVTQNYDTISGWKIGAALDIPLQSHFSIQPEALFHLNNGGSTSTDILGITTKTVISFNSIEFPVLLKAGLNIGAGTISVLVGPTFNIFVGEVTYKGRIANAQKTSTAQFEDLNWSTFVIGLSAGPEFSFKGKNGTFGVGCMFDLDLSDIDKTDSVKTTRFTITPQISYFF